jgi:hypothetical protein
MMAKPLLQEVDLEKELGIELGLGDDDADEDKGEQHQLSVVAAVAAVHGIASPALYLLACIGPSQELVLSSWHFLLPNPDREYPFKPSACH